MGGLVSGGRKISLKVVNSCWDAQRNKTKKLKERERRERRRRKSGERETQWSQGVEEKKEAMKREREREI